MTTFRYRLPALLVLFLAAQACLGQEARVALVNMQRVIKASDEMKQAKAAIKAKVDELETQRDRLLEQLEALKKEVEETQRSAENKALSDDVREAKRELAREKFLRLQEMERDARKELADARQAIADREVEFLKEIVGQLRRVVKAYAEGEGYALVLDSSAVGIGGVDTVVYHADAMDITDAIMERIGVRPEEDDAP
jgi:Skp family chaperone for outer membrane proteins